MGFRDEREALRAKVASLEATLAQREAKDEDILRQLDALSEEVRRLARRQRAEDWQPRRWVIASMAASAAVAALVAVLVSPRGERPAEVAVAEPGPEATAAEASSLGASAEPSPARPPAPRSLPRVADGYAFFEAVVETVEGEPPTPLEPGQGCRIEAPASAFQNLLAPRGLTVRCGEVAIYERPFEHDGQRLDCDVQAQPEAERSVRGALRCRDRGVRPERPELELDTLGGVARIWRTASPSFDVRLRVERATTVVLSRRFGGASHLPLAEAWEGEATVSEVVGFGLTVGATCRATVAPVEARHRSRVNCELSLRCPGVDRSSSGTCLVDEAFALREARTGRQGAEIVIDRVEGSLRVVEPQAELTWMIHGRLEPEP